MSASQIGAPPAPPPIMIYEASPTKRKRATGAEMNERMEALIGIVREIQPCTVRQTFYQATVRGIIEKTEHGYTKVQRALADLRKAGRIPYGWIVDNTRWQRKPKTYGGVAEALADCAKFYRRNLWKESPVYAEIWLEKDALAGVILPVTEQYDVPLMVARGYASLSFLASAAESIREQKKPCYIYHLGDHDPSGVDAGRKIEQTLRELAPGAEIHFRRLAVTPEQIQAWDLPTRPTKQTDTRAAKFGHSVSVELDAIAPELLRSLVLSEIDKHLDHEALKRLKVAEESERNMLWEALELVQEAL